jgi:hypothetical protein
MVEAGRHHVTIDALDHEDLELDLDVQPDAEWRFSHEVRLKRVHPPSQQVALTLHLTDLGTGKPIPRARIEVVETESGEALVRFEGRRADGAYRIPALSGTRKLVVRADGYAEHTATLRLKPDEPEVELEIELRPQ